MSGSGPGAPPVWPKGGGRSHCEGGRKGEGGGLASRYTHLRRGGGVAAVAAVVALAVRVIIWSQMSR
eukprot:4077126-Prymnesium_polylepis.1